jgi:hypothetical protein
MTGGCRKAGESRDTLLVSELPIDSFTDVPIVSDAGETPSDSEESKSESEEEEEKEEVRTGNPV